MEKAMVVLGQKFSLLCFLLDQRFGFKEFFYSPTMIRAPGLERVQTNIPLSLHSPYGREEWLQHPITLSVYSRYSKPNLLL